jgi:putative ABC transport system permease protein
MIKNYFLIAWRNLTRNKLNSFISISGLAVGLTCCILIALYVTDELSYDKQFNRSNDLYRLATGFVKDNVENKNAGSSAPYGPTLRTEYPEVETTTRIFVSPNEDKYLFTVTDGNQLKMVTS